MVDISYTAVSGKKDGVVSIPFTLKKDSYLTNADFAISYDSSKMAPLQENIPCITAGEVWPGYSSSSQATGSVQLSMAKSGTGLQEEGPLFTLSFKLLADVTDEPLTIIATDGAINQGNGDKAATIRIANTAVSVPTTEGTDDQETNPSETNHQETGTNASTGYLFPLLAVLLALISAIIVVVCYLGKKGVPVK